MKKFLFTLATLCLVVSLSAQQASTYNPTMVPVKYSVITGNETGVAPVNHVSSMMKAANGKFIGTTYYDLPTNASMSPKVASFADGTIGAVWTACGTATETRGTGYNYHNGTKWTGEASSTERIENERTGWGTICPVGSKGEIVVSHDGTRGLVIATRANKGTGEWNFSKLVGPEVKKGAETSTTLSWPTMTTNGNTIHLFACTEQTTGYVFEGVQTALVYIRGTYDEATNNVEWENAKLVEGMGSDFVKSYSGDAYNVTSNGDKVAILIADRTTDVFYCISEDNGKTWKRNVVFKSSVENYLESTTLVTDTPMVADGHCSIAIGDDGVVHVSFGTTRILNEDLTDESYTYYMGNFPLVYWNSTMEPITRPDSQRIALDYDNLQALNIPFMTYTDITGDSMLYTLNGIKFPKYGCGGMASQPQLVAKDGKVYWIYSMMLEYPFIDQASGKNYHYRGIFGIKSDDNGVTWDKSKISWLSYVPGVTEVDWNEYNSLDPKVNTYDDYSATIINLTENVYPSVSQNIVNGKLNMIWQNGYLAGSQIKENNVGVGVNEAFWYFLQIDANELGTFNNINEVCKGSWQGISQNNSLSEMKLYPNPATEKVNIMVASAQNSNATITISNLLGQVVYTESTTLNSGANYMSVNVSNLNKGIYVVNVKSTTGSTTQKLIVR